jgi:excisionase family DNA binding protein
VTPPPAPPDRATFTVEEAAALLGVGRGLAYEMARTGRLPILRLGRRVLIPRQALEAMLEGRLGSGDDGRGEER